MVSRLARPVGILCGWLAIVSVALLFICDRSEGQLLPRRAARVQARHKAWQAGVSIVRPKTWFAGRRAKAWQAAVSIQEPTPAPVVEAVVEAPAKAPEVSICPTCPCPNGCPCGCPDCCCGGKKAPAVKAAAVAGARMGYYPNRSGPKYYVFSGGRKYLPSAAHLLNDPNHRDQFDAQWVRSLSAQQLLDLHSDAHSGTVRWDFVMRPAKSATVQVSAPSGPRGHFEMRRSCNGRGCTMQRVWVPEA